MSPQNPDLCRICLASAVRMHTIAGTPLQIVFERISNSRLYSDDLRPVVACFVCYAHLKRSYKLMLTSIEAENTLTSLLRNNQKGAKELPSLTDYKLSSLSGSLCISPVDCIDTFSFNAPIMVKNEPECLQDTIKQEINYEESFSAATVTKSEITEERQPEEYGLKKKKKHASSGHKIKRKHKRRHKDKHLINKDIAPIHISGPEKQIQFDNTLPKTSKCRNSKSKNLAKRFFECNDCQNRFSRKCHLETHMIIHSGERPFQCTFCQKRFNMKHSLDRHLKRHTGEKSFECPVCKRRFLENSVLKIHIRTHTGEQPYECDICEKRFKQRNDLKRHRRTHTGEKPFKCDICQRRFNERSKVTRHQKKHYGEKLRKRDLKKLFM